MRIAVVGSGYVGLVAGACFAELGHQVILVDNDERKLAELQRGECPIHEKFLPELLERHRGKSLDFTGDLAEAVRRSQVIFVAVGTPPKDDGDADLSYVESVAQGIACAIDDYKVIVEKSTVPVYTNSWVRKIMLLNGAPAELFDVASNPEFLREEPPWLTFSIQTALWWAPIVTVALTCWLRHISLWWMAATSRNLMPFPAP